MAGEGGGGCTTCGTRKEDRSEGKTVGEALEEGAGLEEEDGEGDLGEVLALEYVLAEPGTSRATRRCFLSSSSWVHHRPPVACLLLFSRMRLCKSAPVAASSWRPCCGPVAV